MRPPLALVLALALSAACSSSSTATDRPQPKVADFSSGSCRSVAEPVLRLGRELDTLSSIDMPPPDLLEKLKTAQAALRALQPSVEPSLAPTVEKLVGSVGLVRLRADSNSYERQLAVTALEDYDAVIAACTGGP